MENELGKKVKKSFRKCQRKNFWLSCKKVNLEDDEKIHFKLPLDEYPKLVERLTLDELYDLKTFFEKWGWGDVLFHLVHPYTWYKRCCLDLRLFDSFSDEQLEKILNNNGGNVSDLFLADGQNEERQLRILRLLNESSLESWIRLLITCDYQWLNLKMPEGLTVSTNEKNDAIFEKLATLSDYAVAKWMEILEVGPARRLLQEIICLERDVFSICKEIEKDKLYEVVIVKLDLLKDADVERTAEMYYWLYSNIPSKCKFLTYLMEEKLDEIVLFDAEICGEICRMQRGNQAGDFCRRVVEQKEESGDFYKDFYQKMTLEEKEQFFQEFLKDEVGKRVIEIVLEEKESLSLLEELVLEKL